MCLNFCHFTETRGDTAQGPVPETAETGRGPAPTIVASTTTKAKSTSTETRAAASARRFVARWSWISSGPVLNELSGRT